MLLLNDYYFARYKVKSYHSNGPTIAGCAMVCVLLHFMTSLVFSFPLSLSSLTCHLPLSTFTSIGRRQINHYPVQCVDDDGGQHDRLNQDSTILQRRSSTVRDRRLQDGR